MERVLTIICTFLFAALLAGAAFAEEEGGIPARVGRDHWSCKELAELAAKYNAGKKLPDGAELKKRELAAVLLSVLEKVHEQCGKEGIDAVPREDLERLAALHEALKEELAQFEGYLTRREAIEAILARPETPAFEYKLGINGFVRGEGVGNFTFKDFSYQPAHGEGRFLYRVKPYAYWHPTDWLDIHAEGQGYGFTGGSHQEHNKFSLYQGFVEAKLPGREWLALKGGRQEFSYGSTFILGPDSFYDGLSFDAARLQIKPVEPLTVDFLVGAYAPPFSDGIKGNLAGAYATYALSEGNAVEVYMFRDSGATDHKAGEHLYIWGLRGTARIGPVSMEFEPVYESGRAFNTVKGANDRIDSYGGHVDMTFESVLAGYNNKFFLSYALGSGSRDAAGGVTSAGEFRNPNNDTPLVGDMNVIGDLSGVTVNGHHASGLQIYTLGWGIDILKEVNFSATGRYFLANDVEDGMSRRLGLETDFTLTYNVNDTLSVILGYDRFFTGGFFRDASGSGRDINYGYLMLQFDLSRSKPRLKQVKG